MNFIGFGAMEVTKPYELIGFGAMYVTKPYEFKVSLDFGSDSVPGRGLRLVLGPLVLGCSVFVSPSFES